MYGRPWARNRIHHSWALSQIAIVRYNKNMTLLRLHCSHKELIELIVIAEQATQFNTMKSMVIRVAVYHHHPTNHPRYQWSSMVTGSIDFCVHPLSYHDQEGFTCGRTALIHGTKMPHLWPRPQGAVPSQRDLVSSDTGRRLRPIKFCGQSAMGRYKDAIESDNNEVLRASRGHGWCGVADYTAEYCPWRVNQSPLFLGNTDKELDDEDSWFPGPVHHSPRCVKLSHREPDLVAEIICLVWHWGIGQCRNPILGNYNNNSGMNNAWYYLGLVDQLMVQITGIHTSWGSIRQSRSPIFNHLTKYLLGFSPNWQSGYRYLFAFWSHPDNL